MVTEWGMSDLLGPLHFSTAGGEVFLGRDFAKHSEYSDDTARIIDEEIRRIIDEAYQEMTKLLGGQVDALHAIAKALLAREILNADDVAALAAGKSLPDPAPGPSDSPTPILPATAEPEPVSGEDPKVGMPGQPAEGFTG
jgi:cell division protease FtsH